jgi:hypothetical protein
MKSFLFLTLLSLSFIFKVQAQEEEVDPREKFTLGVKAGVNIANVWDTDGEEFKADNRVGFAGGIFVGIPLSDMLGLQPEALISQKGYESSGKLLGQNYKITTTRTYIDFPLQLQIKPMEYFSILLGPQFSYLIEKKDTYSEGDYTIEQKEAFDNDNLRKNLLGFVGGLDLNYKHLVLSGRAGWDFQKNNGDGSSSTPNSKNRWLQFTIGYKI